MEAGGKKQVPKPTPPEDPKTAAGSSENWRERAKSVEIPSKETVPERANNDRPIQKESDPSKRARMVVESDSEDEEETPVPYKKLVKANSESPSREKSKEKPRTQPIPRVGERAYKLVSKFDDKKIVNNLVNKTEKSVLEGVTVGELVAMSPEYAKELRKIVSRTRKPVVSQAMMGAIGQDALPFNDEDSEETDVRYSSRAVEVGELPEVDSFHIATQEDIGTEPGGMIATDPVLQYMHFLPPDETPQPLYMATESASLRVVFPTVNGGERVECVVDSGSQIVSMALKLAERLGIIWDPDVRIHMQSASGEMKRAAGLARNVPFLFGDIPVYLQVHIIDQPAYDVLLGRPFDVLTESYVKNTTTGTQTLTIRDPSSKRRCVIPTHARGVYRTAENQRRASDKAPPEKLERPQSAREGMAEEGDFHSSSRN
jgi:hypothetical protein